MHEWSKVGEEAAHTIPDGRRCKAVCVPVLLITRPHRPFQVYGGVLLLVVPRCGRCMLMPRGKQSSALLAPNVCGVCALNLSIFAIIGLIWGRKDITHLRRLLVTLYCERSKSF